MTNVKFDPGAIVATPGALEALREAGQQPAEFLDRHLKGDWGDLCAHDRAVNEEALRDGSRLFSAYRSRAGVRFYVITESDRSATTVLLPEDY